MTHGWHRATIWMMATLALALPVGAAAQTAKSRPAKTGPGKSAPTNGASLDTLMRTARYQADLARLFATLPGDVFTRCPALVSGESQVTVIQPLRFGADGSPMAGAWKQAFPVSGCGNDTTINVYFTAQPGGHITGMAAMPGDTHADPVLQGDAARGLIAAVRARVPTCGDPHVRNTHFDGMQAQGQVKASGWRETWTVSACGQVMAVPLNFIPEEKGTRIEAAGAPQGAGKPTP